MKRTLVICSFIIGISIIGAMFIYVFKTNAVKSANTNNINTLSSIKINVNDKTINKYIKAKLPEYSLLHKETINLDSKTFVIMVLKSGNYEPTVTINICEYKANILNSIWQLPENAVIKDITPSLPDPVTNFCTLISEDKMSAVIGINTVLFGAHGSSQVTLLTLNSKDECLLKLNALEGIMAVTKVGKSLIVEGEGDFAKHIITIDPQYKEEVITLSQMADANSIKAYFTVSRGLDEVVAANEDIINLKEGDTIAFLPSNEEDKKMFDNGDLSIYVSRDGPNLGQSTLLKTGNSWTFNEIGIFEVYMAIPSNFKPKIAVFDIVVTKK